jgi:hypothetical protein
MSRKNSAAKNSLRDLSITVYPGYALVQGSYPVKLDEGANRFQVEGLPTNYDPGSLYFDAFEGAGEVTLGAASYRAANLSPAACLQRALNKKVTVIYGGTTEAEQKELTGTLVGYTGNNTALVKVKGGVREVRNVVGYIFGSVPKGLSNTPSLAVNVEAGAKGEYVAKLLYKALGLAWNADYKWIYDEARGLITIDGSVSISNHSGATFENASIKVVAGDAGAENDGMMLESAPMAMAASAAPMGGGARRSRSVRQADSESLGQVKVFTIPGRSTLDDNESQKIPFLVAAEVPVGREFRVRSAYGWHHARGSRSEATVQTVLILNNKEENKLGKPLPSGSVAVMQRDASGALLKSGGGYMKDAAVGEEVKLGIGSDFDLKAERVVLDIEKKEEVETLPDSEPATDANFVEEGGLETIEPAVLGTPMAMSSVRHVATPAPSPKAKRLKVTLTKRCAVELFNAKPYEVEFVLEEQTSGEELRFDGEHGFTPVEADRHEKRVKLAAGAKAKVEYTLVQTNYAPIANQR